MNCQQIDNQILNYCEGKLPENLAREIREHIEVCPLCRNNEKWTRLENQILQEPIEVPPLAKDFDARVMSKLIGAGEISAANPAALHRTSLRKGLYTAFTLAAVAAVIVLAIIIPSYQLNDDTVNIAQNNTKIYESTAAKDQITVGSPGKTEEAKEAAEAGARQSEPMEDDAGLLSNKTAAQIQFYDSVPEAFDSNENTNRQNRSLPSPAPTPNRSMALMQAAEAEQLQVLPVPQGLPSCYRIAKCEYLNNEVLYHYCHEDGSRNFAISIFPGGDKELDTFLAKEIEADNSPATNNEIGQDCELNQSEPSAAITQVPSAVIREVQLDNQLFTLKLTGLPEEEASTVLDQITLTFKAMENAEP